MRLIFSKFHIILALALILSAALSFSAHAADATPGLNETQKAEVRQLVKELLRENPEVIIESFMTYQSQQKQMSADAAKGKIEEHKKFLTGSDMPSIGDPKAGVTIVEFFDYNCGYCKKAIGDINNIIKDDKDVRFVFHEMPILAQSSLTAAQYALAAHKQGKYFEFHTAAMEHNGPMEDSVLKKIAEKIGLDVKKLEQDATSPETQAAIEKSMGIAHEIGVQGTPAFIINGTLYPGYLGEDGLKKAITEARGKKS